MPVDTFAYVKVGSLTWVSQQRPAVPQAPKPTIEVDCELFDIHDDPKEEVFYAMVKFRWKAKNTSYVLIKGFSEDQYPVEGEINVEEGANLIFIAVGPNAIASKPVNCLHTWQKATGVHGLKHDVSSQFRESNFQGSYKVLIKTSLSEVNIKDRVLRLLQAKQYSVESDNFSNASAGDLFFHTTDFNFHSNLCYGDDCGKPIGSRRIERQVAFSIWMKRLAKQNEVSTYELHIQPFVMLNYRRQDDKWRVDPDATQVANSVSKELGETLEQRLG